MQERLENRPLQGVLLVVMAMAGIGLIDNFIPMIAEDAGLWQFHFLRACISCPTLILLARFFGWRLRPRNWWAVVTRSLFFSSAMVIYFGAAGFLPIAQAGAGLFSAPIFVLIISAAFLGTRIGFWRIAAVAIGFFGVILILNPEAQGLSLISVLPVFGGLFYALSGIATRTWCAGESTGTLLMGLFTALGIWGLLGLVALSIWPPGPGLPGELGFLTTGWVSPTPRFALLVLMQAFGSLIAVSLLTRGYQLTEVSYVATSEYTFLLFAGFWGYLMWGDILSARAMTGIIAIVLAGVIIAVRTR